MFFFLVIFSIVFSGGALVTVSFIVLRTQMVRLFDHHGGAFGWSCSISSFVFSLSLSLPLSPWDFLEFCDLVIYPTYPPDAHIERISQPCQQVLVPGSESVVLPGQSTKLRPGLVAFSC